MSKWGKLILRVLHSYSIEEKVISVIVFGMVVFFGLQLTLDVFNGSPALAGDAYTEGLVSDKPALVNPLFVDFGEANRDLASLVFSGLVKYDPGKKTFVDDMATLTLSDDHKTYRFTLKSNLLWHDGQPVTADDVYFTFHDLIQSPDFQNPVLKVNFEGVQIKQVDQQTVDFQIQNPNAFFITNFNIGILPKHILGNVKVADLPMSSFNLKPIGSGPYKMDVPMQVFDDGRQLVNLAAFDHYYGQLPKIKHIRFTVYPDEASLMKEKNGLNIVSKVPPQSVAAFQQDQHFTLMPYSLPQYTAVFFNVDRPIIKNQKIRIGLLKTLVKSDLLKTLGDKIAVDTPLLELNQSDWIYKPDLAEAKGAFYDAGFKVDSKSGDLLRRDSKGNVLKLNLLVRAYEPGNPIAKELSTVTDFLKKSWGDLGIQLDVQLAETDDFNKRLQARDYDMVLTGQSLGYNLDTYSYWHSSQIGKDGLNLSNYKSFAADQLIEQIRNSFTATDKDQKLKDLAKVLATDVPAVFLYRPQYYLASDNKIKNISLDSLAYPSDRFSGLPNWCASTCN